MEALTESASVQLMQLQCLLDAKERENDILRQKLCERVDHHGYVLQLEAKVEELERQLNLANAGQALGYAMAAHSSLLPGAVATPPPHPVIPVGPISPATDIMATAESAVKLVQQLYAYLATAGQEQQKQEDNAALQAAPQPPTSHAAQAVAGHSTEEPQPPTGSGKSPNAADSPSSTTQPTNPSHTHHEPDSGPQNQPDSTSHQPAQPLVSSTRLQADPYVSGNGSGGLEPSAGLFGMPADASNSAQSDLRSVEQAASQGESAIQHGSNSAEDSLFDAGPAGNIPYMVTPTTGVETAEGALGDREDNAEPGTEAYDEGDSSSSSEDEGKDMPFSPAAYERASSPAVDERAFTLAAGERASSPAPVETAFTPAAGKRAFSLVAGEGTEQGDDEDSDGDGGDANNGMAHCHVVSDEDHVGTEAMASRVMSFDISLPVDNTATEGVGLNTKDVGGETLVDEMCARSAFAEEECISLITDSSLEVGLSAVLEAEERRERGEGGAQVEQLSVLQSEREESGVLAEGEDNGVEQESEESETDAETQADGVPSGGESSTEGDYEDIASDVAEDGTAGLSIKVGGQVEEREQENLLPSPVPEASSGVDGMNDRRDGEGGRGDVELEVEDGEIIEYSLLRDVEGQDGKSERRERSERGAGPEMDVSASDTFVLGPTGLPQLDPPQSERVLDLNVGGWVFQVAASTLLQVPNSRLHQLLSQDAPARRDSADRLFLPYDVESFRGVLFMLQEMELLGTCSPAALDSLPLSKHAYFTQLLKVLRLDQLLKYLESSKPRTDPAVPFSLEVKPGTGRAVHHSAPRSTDDMKWPVEEGSGRNLGDYIPQVGQASNRPLPAHLSTERNSQHDARGSSSIALHHGSLAHGPHIGSNTYGENTPSWHATSANGMGSISRLTSAHPDDYSRPRYAGQPVYAVPSGMATGRVVDDALASVDQRNGQRNRGGMHGNMYDADASYNQVYRWREPAGSSPSWIPSVGGAGAGSGPLLGDRYDEGAVSNGAWGWNERMRKGHYSGEGVSRTDVGELAMSQPMGGGFGGGLGRGSAIDPGRGAGVKLGNMYELLAQRNRSDVN